MANLTKSLAFPGMFLTHVSGAVCGHLFARSTDRYPNDAPDANFDGYNFWLNKLNQFNGNFVQAEMVRAFIDSSEYRRRFGT